jgi:hypothetical protein
MIARLVVHALLVNGCCCPFARTWTVLSRSESDQKHAIINYLPALRLRGCCCCWSAGVPADLQQVGGCC